MKIIFSLVFLMFFKGLVAQKDSMYILRMTDDESFLALPSVRVTVLQNGIQVKDWEGNYSGDLSFSKRLISGDFTLSISARSYTKKILKNTDLKINDTNDVRLSREILYLNSFELIQYQVPYIGSERKYYKNTKTGQKYTEEQLQALQVLSQGKWYRKEIKRMEGVMKMDTLGKYLMRYLRYPKLSLDLEEQETIVMRFDVDIEGYTNNIRLITGKSPILALEVATAIARMPRLVKFYDPYDPPLRPVIVELPVKFKLK